MATVASAIGSYTGSTTTGTCAVPTGTVAGHRIAALVWWEGTSQTVSGLSGPGWTSKAMLSSSGTQGRCQWHISDTLVGTPPATITVTMTGNAPKQLILVTLSGRQASGDPVPVGGNPTAFSNSQNPTALNVTTGVDGTDVLDFLQAWEGPPTPTAPSGFTLRANDTAVGNFSWSRDAVGSGGLTGVQPTGLSATDLRWHTALAVLPASGVARAMAGTSDSISDATGTLVTDRPLAGATDSISDASGTLIAERPLAGTADSISDATGTLQSALPLTGATDSVSNASGTLIADRPLAGATDSVSNASGTLITERPLAGVTDSVSDASGVLATQLSLAGTTDSASSATGELVTARDLAGATDSISDATGALEVATALGGASDSIGSATGDLSISGQVDLASVSDSTVDASGDLSSELALAGTADSTSSGGGTLSTSGWVELEGATLETGGASGSLSGPVKLEGATDATDGATGQLTVSGEVKRDTMVLPIARDLLACLCEAVAEAPNPPASCCLRPGVTVAQGVSEREDECCEGLAWVRVSRVFPSGDEAGFPNVNEQTSACNPTSYGIELEMGVYRCAPTGDERNLPTCDEWTVATEQILDDAASMRRAWCCFRDNYANDAKLIGQWTPVEVQGGCTGGKMTIMIESYCTDCIADGS